MPDVITPWLGWVVSQAVREALNSIETIDFLEVRFEKLFDYPVDPAGDFSWYDENDPSRRRDPRQLFEQLSDVEEYRLSVPKYAEMLVPAPGLVRHRYPELRDVLIDVELSSSRKAQLCVEMFSDFPILEFGGTMLFREDVFRVIETSIDWDYFLKQEIRL